jgi:hypothetical protein
MTRTLRRCTAMVCILTTLSMVGLPRMVLAGNAADDLKQIEYQYYFRGKYQQAIESLQMFLARVDLDVPTTLRAREVLAASYVLGGAPAMGKEVFAQIIAGDPGYAGPDSAVFKLEVVNVYAEARADWASRQIRQVPPLDAQTVDMTPAAIPAETGKPIYKKWWFYAGAATLLAVVGVAAAGGDDSPRAADTGTVVVGVTVQ